MLVEAIDSRWGKGVIYREGGRAKENSMLTIPAFFVGTQVFFYANLVQLVSQACRLCAVTGHLFAHCHRKYISKYFYV